MKFFRGSWCQSLPQAFQANLNLPNYLIDHATIGTAAENKPPGLFFSTSDDMLFYEEVARDCGRSYQGIGFVIIVTITPENFHIVKDRLFAAFLMHEDYDPPPIYTFKKIHSFDEIGKADSWCINLDGITPEELDGLQTVVGIQDGEKFTYEPYDKPRQTIEGRTTMFHERL